MTTAIEYALMAGHAYRTTRDETNWIPAPRGWTPFFPVPDPNTASTFPATGGFEAISFQSATNPNEIVISFAGTGPGWSDWIKLKGSASHYLWFRAGEPASVAEKEIDSGTF